MKIKDKARQLGKIIRRGTGLPLPEAMRIAKLVVRDRISDAMAEFASITRAIRRCSDTCCSFEVFEIRGPRGCITSFRDLSFESIMREAKITVSTP